MGTGSPWRYCANGPTPAEMIKYTSNAMLATAISFADLGSGIGGIDAVDVMRGVHLIPVRHWAHSAVSRTMRAGPTAFYEARCGYGGSCL